MKLSIILFLGGLINIPFTFFVSVNTVNYLTNFGYILSIACILTAIIYRNIENNTNDEQRNEENEIKHPN
jgi:H+/Cl- antiporter ClcA